MPQQPMETVTLADVLAAKERKAEALEALRRQYHASVVAIAVNMPGPVKYSEDTRDLVLVAMQQLRDRLNQESCRVLEERLYHAATGPVAILAVDGDARTIKNISIAIEEESDYARLLDVDVHDYQGHQLSRTELNLPTRRCLVCAGEASVCVRAIRHPREEVIAAANRLLSAFRSGHRRDNS